MRGFNLNRGVRKIYLIFLALSLASLVYAYLGIEVLLGLMPCILCILIRFEVLLIIVVSIIGLIVPNVYLLWLIFLLILSMLATSIYLVKLQFFSVENCSDIDLGVLNFLYKYTKNYDCSVIDFPMFPISTQTMFFSFFMLFIFLSSVFYFWKIAKYERKIW